MAAIVIFLFGGLFGKCNKNLVKRDEFGRKHSPLAGKYRCCVGQYEMQSKEKSKGVCNVIVMGVEGVGEKGGNNYQPKRSSLTEDHEEKVRQQQQQQLDFTKQKWRDALLFAVMAMFRASLNFLANKFTLAYHTTLINSISPLVISWADSYFLGTKLPKTIWPALVMTMIGYALVVISQSPWMNQDDQYIFSNKDTLGCALAFLSAFFAVVCRILQKTTAETLTPNELVQCGNIGTILVPLILSLWTYPRNWLLLFQMSGTEFALWLFMSVGIFAIGGPAQVSLIRILGAGVYSSLSGVRVLGSVALSTLLLNEPVKNKMEWLGIVFTVGTISWYVHGLSTSVETHSVSGGGGPVFLNGNKADVNKDHLSEYCSEETKNDISNPEKSSLIFQGGTEVYYKSIN